ncbi:MAG: ankyrin repeat domain-containing protein [Alphaproteobacteria bacterium]
MASGKEDFMEAIRTGDVAFLREYLRQNPEERDQKVGWDHYDGYPLNYAAFCNQPKVISFLVLECKADVNRNQAVGANWTPLHHAQEKSCYEAAGMLLSLGANPSVGADGGKTTADFCSSKEVQRHRDPHYAEKLARKMREMEQAEREKKITGAWSRTGAREITHDYEQPDIGCRMMDIFNFETRCLRAIVKNTDGPGMAQSILFFDDMPAKEILRPAAQKLKELGVEVDDSEIGETRIIKKSFRPRPS